MIGSFSSIFASSEGEGLDPHHCFPHYNTFLPPGLGNPGNLCYLNSLLQTFASSDQWMNFFNKCPQENQLIKEITEVLKKLREPFSTNTISTKQCRKLMKQSGITVDITVQEDIQEFYTLFTELIATLLKQKTTSKLSAFSTLRIFPTCCIYEESFVCPVCNSSVTQVNQTSTFVMDIFSGSLRSSMEQFFGPVTMESKCTTCNKITKRVLKRTILFVPKSILFFTLSKHFINLS